MSGATAGDKDRTRVAVSGLEMVVTVAGNLTPGGRNSKTLVTFGANFVVRINIVLVGPEVNTLGGFMAPEKNEGYRWRRNFPAAIIRRWLR